jgi:hypothetical protein
LDKTDNNSLSGFLQTTTTTTTTTTDAWKTTLK